MSSVALWRTDWLSYSETFILTQSSQLKSWGVVYVGLRKNGVLAPDSVQLIVDLGGVLGRIRYLAFGWLGVSSSFSKVLRSTRVKLIHAHFGPDAVLVERFASRTGLPLVVTLHGYDVSSKRLERSPRGVLYRWRLRRVLRRAAVVVCVSSTIQRLAVSAGAPLGRTRVIFNGVDMPDACRPEPSASAPLVAVGRLVEKKGFEDLIRALAVAGGTFSVARLEIIGTGPLADQLAALALKLRADVVFLGALSHADTLSRIEAARFLAVPSRTALNGEVEGLPTVIPEAFARGVPVIGTRHSGIPDAVVDGFNGVLANEADVADLSRAIKRAYGFDYASLSRGARATAAAEFNVLNQVEKIEEVYREVVGA